MKKIMFLLMFLWSVILIAADPYTIKPQYQISPQGVEVILTLSLPKGVKVYRSQFFEITSNNNHGVEEQQTITLPSGQEEMLLDGSQIKILKRFINSQGEWSFDITLTTQGCEEEICYPPQDNKFSFSGKIPENSEVILGKVEDSLPMEGKNTSIKDEAILVDNILTKLSRFKIVRRESGFLDAEQFIAFLETEAEGRSLENFGFLALLITILLGGLALNLTPCVLPMIPINLGIIGAGIASGSKKQGFLRGGFYALGITIAYGILGIVVAFGGFAFGALNSSPWFNFVIAFIFVVLGLSMLDLFIIDLSHFRSQQSAERAGSGRFLPIFFLGAMSALLAGACVAPIVIAVLVIAVKMVNANNYWGFVLPFILGIGMALPWPFAGAGMSVLPKPGMWMVKLKKVMAIFILIFSAYYAYIGYSLLPKKTNHANNPMIVELQHLDQVLSRSLESDQTLVIDFWASWCKSCVKMKKTTFSDSKVKEKLSKVLFIPFQAEDIQDKELSRILSILDVKGLPSILILEPIKE